MCRLKKDGERFLPWMEDAVINYEHLHRYGFTKKFVKGKKVLDLGCGEGYGSFLLAEKAESVLGIDIDEAAISHASHKYIRANLRFKVGDIRNLPVRGEELFDVVVCFELFEHIKEQDESSREVKRLLKDDGLFIISTPNKLLHSDKKNYNNPFHLKELYFAEFADLLKKYFKNVSFLGQRVFPVSNIWALDGNYKNWEEFCIKRPEDTFKYASWEEKSPLYFIAIASDDKIDSLPNSYLVDTSFALIREKEAQIANLERVLKEKTPLNNLAYQLIMKCRRLKGKILFLLNLVNRNTSRGPKGCDK